ncbi:MAG TPA: universal stress protein, partial [Thermoanaerobaculia bacterium]|nr:universal stress protein [Thermoanaerobaculia bacterium]
MLQVNRILFPTDFSPTSDAALTPACHWARRLGAELHLLHVVETLRPELYASSIALPDPSIVGATLQARARQELETRCRLARDRGATITCDSREGLSPAPAILEYAESHDVDLIAMSTHGRRGLRRFLLGSITEEVVQRSSSPVLTLRGENSIFDAVPHRILAAVDLSQHSPAAITHAKELAALLNAELQLLHVLVRPPIPVYYDATAAPNLLPDLPQLEKEALAGLEELYERSGGPSGPVSLHVAEGLAVQEILRFAEVNSSDVVVV